MSRDTRLPGLKWAIALAVVSAGLMLGAAIDFAFRHPLPSLAFVGLVLAFTGRSAPFNYTGDALAPLRGRAARFAHTWIDPIVIVVLLEYALHQAIYVGFGTGLTVAGLVYLGDRVAAWIIRGTAPSCTCCTWLGRRRRTRPAEVSLSDSE